MLRSLFPFVSLVLLALPAIAATNSDCTPAEQKFLKAAYDQSRVEVKKLVHSIESAGDRGWISNWHLYAAGNVARCAQELIPVSHFVCRRMERYNGETLPVPYSNIYINVADIMRKRETEAYLRFFTAAVIIHEATHQCGTTDAAYFWAYNDPPRSVGLIGWPNIADTYSYWVLSGFCVPGDDCEGRKFPK